jgi:hypothetical protein
VPSPQDWFVGKLEELRSAAGSPTQAQLLARDQKARKALTRSSLSDLLAARFKKAPPWERVAAYGIACVSVAQADGIPLPLESTLEQLRGDHNVLTGLLETSTRKPAVRAQRSEVSGRLREQPRPSRRMFGAVPARADAFQHRTVSTQLSGAIEDGGIAVLTGAMTTPVTVLTGLGGVGKTQLAADRAHKLWDTGALDLLVWISARSRDAAMAAYTEVAADLLGQDPAMPERASRRLLQWLAETSRRWLIVFDDLQRPDDLTGLWPPYSAVGQVVVTTRRRDAALYGHNRQIVDIDLYTSAESLSYLIEKLPSRARTDHEKATLASLAADLGYLPLALAQAAAYLINRPLLATADYCARLTEHRTALLDVLPNERELPDEHSQTVAATWAMSIDAADQLEPRGVARAALELTSLFDPAGIPASSFTTDAVTNHLADRLGRDLTLEEAVGGLECLHRFNLLSLDPSEPHRTIRVHALVQRAVRDSLTDDELDDLAWAAADALFELWPDIEADQELAQTLRSNAAALQATAKQRLWHPHGHELLLRDAQSLGEAGLLDSAMAAAARLLDQALAHLGPEHPTTLTIRADLAYWKGEAGDLAGAAEVLEALLVDQQRILGPEHPDTLSTRASLAARRGQAGDPAGTAEVLEDLLADYLRLLGPEHPDTLSTRNNIAYWRGEAGDPVGAAEAFKNLLGDYLHIVGPDAPETLTARHNLARWRAEAGDPTGAAEVLVDLLADRERVLGPEHPHTLSTRANLAARRGEAGDAARAVEAFERLLGDYLRIVGSDHPDALSTRANLAYWRGETGDFAGAAEAFENLLAEQLRILGPEHPHTLITRNNIAHWRAKGGDFAGAVETLESLFAEQLRILGSGHPHTLRTRGNLASLQGEAGDPAGAVIALEDLLVEQLRVLGADHPGTLGTRNNLANMRGDAGDPAGAAEAFEELLADYLRVLGPDASATLTVRNNLNSWRERATR